MLGDDGKFFAEKPKPKKAQKSQKAQNTKSNRKSPTPTFIISLSGSAATLFGYNVSIGVAFNPGQGKMYGFVRHGMSAGAALSGSVSIGVADQDIEETRASGSGLEIAPEKNTKEIEANYSYFGVSGTFNSEVNGGGIIGGSLKFGKGGGIIVNETFQSYETKTIYYNKVGKEFNQKPSKFYRR